MRKYLKKILRESFDGANGNCLSCGGVNEQAHHALLDLKKWRGK